jgi:hypothetical protein
LEDPQDTLPPAPIRKIAGEDVLTSQPVSSSLIAIFLTSTAAYAGAGANGGRAFINQLDSRNHFVNLRRTLQFPGHRRQHQSVALGLYHRRR